MKAIVNQDSCIGCGLCISTVPEVFEVNADGKADYVNGITPDYKLNERGLISPLLPLGDENELMLKNTLSLITTGTMPDAEKPEETETQSAKVLYNSLSRKKINGVLLR